MMKRIAITPLAALALASAAPGAELLGFYDFEGDFDDNSTAANNPTAVDPDVTFGPGLGGGQAAVFDGNLTQTGINVPIDMNPTVNPNLTIGGWVNANAVNNSSPFGGDDGGWDRGISTGGLGTSWGVSNGQFFNSQLPVGGGWQFLAVTYRGNTATLNVDGSVFTQVGFPGPAVHTGMAIGSLNPGGVIHPFNGSIDNFFVYDDALTARQLEQIRSNGVSAITQTNDPLVGPRTLQTTWDFETGTLSGWNIVTTGVPGSNNVFTSGGQPANVPGDNANIDASAQGGFYVRTWDGEAGGLGFSDAPTGVIRSDEFTLGPNAEFDFLVGGGVHPFTGDPDDPTLPTNITAFTLEREVAPNDWEVIFSANGVGGSGGDGNFFREGYWDAGLYEGETVRLGIYDTHSGGWGHIDVDDIRYSTALTIPEPAAFALFGLAGLGLVLRRRR